jgi:phospholipid/cholesterol/gamma-HCH transport system substrate-binding protein
MDKLKEILVGVLVVAAIALCILFIFTFGGFEKKRNHYELKAMFNDVNSLETGTPVILNGVKVGDVKDIYIENEKVAVILNIKNNIKIRKGARIAIMLKGLIGDLTVGIYNPKEGEEYLKNGDIISGIDPVSVNSIIEKSYDIMKVSDKLINIIEKMEMENSIEDSKIIIKNLKIASEKLSSTLDSTKTTMDSANQIMVQNKKGINESVAATRDLIKKIDIFIEKGDKNLNEVTANISETMKQIKDTLATNKVDIDKTVKNFEKISSKTAMILEKVNPEEVNQIKLNLIEITNNMKEIMKKINEVSKDGKNENIKESIRKAKESTDKVYAILNNKINFEGQIEINNKKKFSGNIIAEIVNKESNIYIKGEKNNLDQDFGKNSLTAGKYFKNIKAGAGIIKDKAGFEGGYFINKKISINGEYYDLKNSNINLGADYNKDKYHLYIRYDFDDIYKMGAGYKF